LQVSVVPTYRHISKANTDAGAVVIPRRPQRSTGSTRGAFLLTPANLMPRRAEIQAPAGENADIVKMQYESDITSPADSRKNCQNVPGGVLCWLTVRLLGDVPERKARLSNRKAPDWRLPVRGLFHAQNQAPQRDAKRPAGPGRCDGMGASG